jgi:phosphate starvation-inducible protein PhoH and related proteins
MSKRKNKQRKPNIKPSRKKIQPKSENQAEYLRLITECDVTLCSGPAGSGKTACSVGLACDWILNKKINNIVVARPAIEAGRGLGHLPGSLNDKVQPYMIPVLEEMKKYLGLDTYNSMRATKTIEVCPLEFMRGRTFDDSLTILDEAQNATYEQIIMFITRLGMHSTAVINGDPDQTDLKGREAGAFYKLMDELDDLEGVGICELEACDIVRNPIIGRIMARTSGRR